MDYFAAYDLTAAFRALAFLTILFLLMLFAIIFSSRRRLERMEQKEDATAEAMQHMADALGVPLDVKAKFMALDKKYGRESGFAALE